MILAAVGGLSAWLALVLTPGLPVWPGWVYMVLPVLMPLQGRMASRAASRLSDIAPVTSRKLNTLLDNPTKLRTPIDP
ncbi:MAG: hypothetical protein ACREL7_18035 [Longimicrobiales bacterium]